jgi:ketose-bisphosphate aldolase
MKINGKELLKNKKKLNKAVPAFNVSSIEVLQAIFEVAGEQKSEIIIETSRGESEHLQPELLYAVTEKLAQMHGVDYALHLDRSDDLEWMKVCLDAGYNSIAAEFKEKDYDKNLELTLKARELTNKYDAQMEGVVDVVPMVYYKEKEANDLVITHPETAKKFTEESGCDSLVISIGTESGKYKGHEKIRIDVLEEVVKLIPEMPLVLHGGSFLEDELVMELIQKGITKINVNSELRIAYTDQLKKNIEIKPEEYAPYRLLSGVKDALKKVVESKIKLVMN